MSVVEPITGITNALDSLRRVNGDFDVIGGESEDIIRGNFLERITDSFADFESIGTHLLVNMIAPADLFTSFGALATVGGCCEFFPTSVASELPACVDICD